MADNIDHLSSLPYQQVLQEGVVRALVRNGINKSTAKKGFDIWWDDITTYTPSDKEVRREGRRSEKRMKEYKRIAEEGGLAKAEGAG
jgi:hypothetical protein